MKQQMRNLTYRNMLIVVHKIEAKGYDLEESVEMARRIFDEFAACPQGLSIEARIGLILTKEEFEREYALLP